MPSSKGKSFWAQHYRKITVPHVKKAMRECDTLGEKAFLKKYGFRMSRGHFLYEDGKYYASKAIAAVAFGHANPKIGPLNPNSTSMSGGDVGATKAASVLKNLGFTVATGKSKSKSGSGEKVDTQKAKKARKTILAEIEIRQGQPAFRKALLKEYGGKCTVSGCKAEGLLEAAHIIPYRKRIKGGENPRNGLLLRADLHTAFDKGLLAVNPETMEVALAPELGKEKDYKKLHGKPLAKPHPDEVALKWHWKHVAKTAVKK